jgi:outer membrane receptor protein involved in Fe transport
MTPRFTLTPLALATASFLFATAAAAQGAVAAAPAEAASAPAAPAAQAAPAEPMSLERVVVTGTSTAGTKMKQSVSISTLESEQIINSGATSVAELLRTVPGVHSENSGGEGNANVTVRGVPISAGGSRYVQFQEDGLPVLMFGDIAFGTPDQFVRTDYNVDHLEVLRGGSASTLASNAPGGIVNFISKTGDDPGGTVGWTQGLGTLRERRIDIDDGGLIGARTRFHIGGFDRTGNGGRPTGFDAAQGGQIKANVTHAFDDGYIRLYGKALDDTTPTYLPVPVYTTPDGHIQRLPGIDPRTAFFISPSAAPDVVQGRDGNPVTTSPTDGLHVVSNAIGAEAHFAMAGGWSIDDKFRKASNHGRFIGLFPSNNGDGATPQTSTTFTGVLFNTSINDLGNTVNDLKVSKTFGDASTGRTVVTAGLFDSVQDVSLTWYWNTYTVQMQNSGASATLLNTAWTTFGGCCVRNFDVSYHNTAPYAAVSWEYGPVTVDGSVRRESQRANGWAELGDAATQQGWNTAGREPVDYHVSHTSYSIGANWALSKDLALFARDSDGVAYAADRLLYGNPLDGSVPISVNEVKQFEGGAKWHAGGLNLFATFFDARTDESNYEATTQLFTANSYRARGLELEAGWSAGAFRLNAGSTWTRSRISRSSDATTIGKTPRRLSNFVFNVAPSYVFGPVELGAGVLYNGKAWGNDANTITLPAYTVVNAFVNWSVNDRLTLSLTGNNLGNAIGYTEIEGDGHAARSINGRTATAALRYSF